MSTSEQAAVAALLNWPRDHAPSDDWLREALAILGLDDTGPRAALLARARAAGLDVYDRPGMKAAQEGTGYVPLHPTDGWVMYELRALGVETRGWSDDERRRELRRRGYDCRDGPVPSNKPDIDNKR